MNSSLGEWNATEDNYEYNNTNDSYVYAEGNTDFVLRWNVWISISFITCCIGLVGNGYIIWLLGFQIKRNCFTTFILNLAVADFGFLTCAFIHHIHPFTNFLECNIFYHVFNYFTRVMLINTNFLLAAISIDRCVAILFPIWHRCSRPNHLSSVVCAFLWISCFLLSGIISVMEIFLKSFHSKRFSEIYNRLMMNSSQEDVDAAEIYYRNNYTNDSYENAREITAFSEWILWKGLTLITCCVGLVGNGYIIWLLGFQIRRNCFTTFILNLAIADFGVSLADGTEWRRHVDQLRRRLPPKTSTATDPTALDTTALQPVTANLWPSANNSQFEAFPQPDVSYPTAASWQPSLVDSQPEFTAVYPHVEAFPQSGLSYPFPCSSQTIPAPPPPGFRSLVPPALYSLHNPTAAYRYCTPFPSTAPPRPGLPQSLHPPSGPVQDGVTHSSTPFGEELPRA
ncbi:PREDICTED: uncharacterized protein LOC106549660 [Thamnophis sirtalis]|uniref:Uncharacterized protein LOC106549660 n=1 Tax=Thamnophis sirtalis TaxID=35019 RepID=A0A6I9YF99_9SAUR|nr:PREDICTED: uncharacterized protein LOC106549660 [Thamnophis sirtalis]